MFVIFQDDQWVGYDKVSSIKRKMEYVRNRGLGGAMIWAIDLDDYKGVCGPRWPLLSQMNLILRRKLNILTSEFIVSISSILALGGAVDEEELPVAPIEADEEDQDNNILDYFKIVFSMPKRIFLKSIYFKSKKNAKYYFHR